MVINLKRIVFFLLTPILTCMLAPICFGQVPVREKLGWKVSFFEFADVPITTPVRRLADMYYIPIGLEVVTEKKGERTKRISIKVEEGTIRDVLDAIVQADPRYKWEEVNDVINIFPKEAGSPLLETVVSHFQVDQVNKVIASSAISETPEVKKKIKEMGISRAELIALSMWNIPPPDFVVRFSLNLYNVTVRRILNEIMKAAGSNYWVFYRYGDNNEFFSMSI